jgi:hypothetical protein
MLHWTSTTPTAAKIERSITRQRINALGQSMDRTDPVFDNPTRSSGRLCDSDARRIGTQPYVVGGYTGPGVKAAIPPRAEVTITNERGGHLAEVRLAALDRGPGKCGGSPCRSSG